MKALERIIIYCLPGLGDALLFTPVLPFLRRAFPRARITILTMFRGAQEILQTNPNVNEVLLCRFMTGQRWKSLRFLLNLRREKFGLSIMAFPAYRREYNILSYLVRARVRWAHRFESGYWSQMTFLNQRTIPVRSRLHNVENNLEFLSALNIPFDPSRARIEIYLKPEEEEFAHKFLSQRQLDDRIPLIGLHPGSIHYRQAWKRRWPTEKFAQLLRRLQNYGRFQFLIFEGPSEKNLGQEIKPLFSGRVEVVADLPIRKVAALIKRCRLFISNDSGLMHLAAACRRPVVAILGPTNPDWIYPWGTRSRIVRRELECAPCYTYTQRRLYCLWKDYRCLKYLDVEMVFQACQELLEERD